jgi:hypothetical protein
VRADSFFARHPVFRLEAFVAAHGGPSAAKVLEYHARVGRIVSVRRGVWAVVPAGQRPGSVEPDALLLGCCLFEGGAISHGSALAFHRGSAPGAVVTVATTGRGGPVELFGRRVVPVQIGRARQEGGEGGVERVLHAGGELRVTSRARTLVDVLGEPGHAGGLRDAWQALRSLEPIAPVEAAREALLHRSPVLAARLGYWLETGGSSPPVAEALSLLERARPAGPVRLERDGPGELVRRWNLVVPQWARRAEAGRRVLPATLSEPARVVAAVLGREALTADELATSARLPVREVLAVLLELELAAVGVKRQGRWALAGAATAPTPRGRR